MSFVSEAIAANTAYTYEKILLDAQKRNNKDVIDFCKKHILPLYYFALDDAMCSAIRNQSLIDFFEREHQ